MMLSGLSQGTNDWIWRTRHPGCVDVVLDEGSDEFVLLAAISCKLCGIWVVLVQASRFDIEVCDMMCKEMYFLSIS